MDRSVDIKEQVRTVYAEAAKSVREGKGEAMCCGPSCCSVPFDADFTAGSYSSGELDVLPETARLASLGCGNPTALAELKPGEIVLDLGSGGGIDVLLAAQRVGPHGKAIGVDMTDEMLALARENQAKSGVTNVEFLKGDIEAIPLPDASVDVIISNCVINLAADKSKVLSEAHRVLKPGGRLSVSDIVFVGKREDVDPTLLKEANLWAGCIAGALTRDEYLESMNAAGFAESTVEVWHYYEDEIPQALKAGLASSGVGVRVGSANVRGRKGGD